MVECTVFFFCVGQGMSWNANASGSPKFSLLAAAAAVNPVPCSLSFTPVISDAQTIIRTDPCPLPCRVLSPVCPFVFTPGRLYLLYAAQEKNVQGPSRPHNPHGTEARAHITCRSHGRTRQRFFFDCPRRPAGYKTSSTPLRSFCLFVVVFDSAGWQAHRQPCLKGELRALFFSLLVLFPSFPSIDTPHLHQH